MRIRAVSVVEVIVLLFHPLQHVHDALEVGVLPARTQKGGGADGADAAGVLVLCHGAVGAEGVSGYHYATVVAEAQDGGSSHDGVFGVLTGGSGGGVEVKGCHC